MADDLRARAGHQIDLCVALGLCDPSDAGAICAAFLDTLAAGMPPLDPWGDLRADAAFWADCATTPELEAYFSAALRMLGKRAKGIGARKRLFAGLWNSFDQVDRLAFLARVDAEGKFIHRGTE